MLVVVVVCFQAKYEATTKSSSAGAKAGMLSTVRTMVFGVRGEIDLASERLERAVEQGEEAQHSTAIVAKLCLALGC